MSYRYRMALFVGALVFVAAASGTFQSARAVVHYGYPQIWPLQRAEYYNWNRPYAHAQYGQPVAMVVPPTATLQTNWGWGVSSFRLSRLDHQFGRNYPGPGTFGMPFRNTPVWPSDTNQFGVYHVRGPW